jgi:hypothetical protein
VKDLPSISILEIFPSVKLATTAGLGTFIEQEDDNGDAYFTPVSVVTSEDEVWEIFEAMGYGGGGSLCGAGEDLKWKFKWRVIRTLPAGSFEFLKQFPVALKKEHERRLSQRRGVKRFENNARFIPMDFIDELSDTLGSIQKGWDSILEQL